MKQTNEHYIFEMDAVNRSFEQLPPLVDDEEHSLESSTISSESFEFTKHSAKTVNLNTIHRTNDCICDACGFCEDSCQNPSCQACSHKLKIMKDNDCANKSHGLLKIFDFNNENKRNFYTMCQVRRHNHSDSAWLLVGNNIYDVTSYLSIHPGGKRSILKMCGGVKDCKEDMKFHSQKAQRIWKEHFIGYLKPCPAHRA